MVFVGVADALVWHVVPDAVGMIGIVLVIAGVVLLLNLRNPKPKHISSYRGLTTVYSYSRGEYFHLYFPRLLPAQE